MIAEINMGARRDTSAVLRSALFGVDEDSLHEPWRQLMCTPAFRRRTDASVEEQVDTAYRRLRLLNDAVRDPVALVRDPVRLACLHEWLGFVDHTLLVAATIHYNLFLGSIVDHDARGAEELAPYLEMGQVGTFLMTEVGHGNDASAVETLAVYDREADGFTVHTPCAAAQKFMPNTSPVGGPKTGVVGARLVVDGTDHGVHLFVVPLTNATHTLPGVRVRRLSPRLGSPLDHSLTSFDGVRVGRGALLAGSGGRMTDEGVFVSEVKDQRQRYLASVGRVMSGKLCMSAGSVGSARAVVALAVRYGRNRRITGLSGSTTLPVFALRSHHGPLVEAVATVYAMSMLYRRAARRWSTHDTAGRAEAGRLVSVAKAWISWQARDVCLEARERCGAQGLLAHNGFADQLTAVEGVITAEGDNQATVVKAAAELLFAPQRAPRQVPDPHGRELTEPGFLHDLLASAEVLWLERARTAMRRAPSEALARRNAAMGPALRAIEVHAHRQAAEATAEAAAALPLGEARELLDAVHLLFALRGVRAQSGDLLSKGFLSTRHIDELPMLHERLVGLLAKDVTVLVDGFAVPEEFLEPSPIAREDYVSAYDDPEGPWNRQGPSGPGFRRR
ncbi:acyl-CoA dehydrogenase family protein [Streptomyces prunicolor]|uniref:acyl-CoA dehydrogenase family protein n=1 Tax=Streptomyces prunicolor TaxID=67348 RepID=UPI00131A1B3F|nr:acyl-CoA dehydrogenase [Streptomyces prunicolor]